MERRHFLMGTAAAGAMRASALASPNDTVRVACVGVRGQGGAHISSYSKMKNVEIAAICDIDESVLEKRLGEVEKSGKKRPAGYTDIRKLLEDKSIDAISIATPNHTHTLNTIWGCQAGKDVYVEKPLATSIEEGRAMLTAAQKHGRVVQMGSQWRSCRHIIEAAEFIRSGKLGKIGLVRGWAFLDWIPSIGKPADGNPPPGVDYDLWLGPAPKRPFNPNRFHYNWRFFWDYGNTELGNQGVHMLDVAMWGIEAMRGLDNCLPKRIVHNGGIYWLDDAKEVPDTQVVTYDYGDLMLMWEMHSFQQLHPIEASTTGTAFYGTEGTQALFTGLATQIVYGGCDHDTADFYSKASGTTTADANPDPQKANFRQRPLLTVDEVVTPQIGNCTIFARYDEAAFATQVIMTAQLTRLYERDDWKRHFAGTQRHAAVVSHAI